MTINNNAQKEFKPTYVAKVEISKNKYRYFYTKAEYEAYLNGKNKTTADKPKEKPVTKKSVFSNLFSKLKNVASGISSVAKKLNNSLTQLVKRGTESATKTIAKSGDIPISTVASSDVAKNGQKIVSGFVNKTQVTTETEAEAKTMPTVTTEKIENGKASADKALEKISDKPVGSVATAALATTGATVAKSLLSGLFGGLIAAAVTAVAYVAKKVVTSIKQKIEAKKAEKERRDRLSDEYEAFLDSDPPKSFDELRMKDEGPTDLETWEDATNDILDINEQYAEAASLTPPDMAATENCSYCTAAYDLRRRGYDVEAGPYDSSDPATTVYELASWYDGANIRGGDYEPYNVTADGRWGYQKAAAEVEADILKQGDGARGHFCVYWETGGGHDVAYEVVDGQVHLLDCQTRTHWTVSDIMSYANSVAYFRTDNLEPNEKVLSKIRNDDD